MKTHRCPNHGTELVQEGHAADGWDRWVCTSPGCTIVLETPPEPPPVEEGEPE